MNFQNFKQSTVVHTCLAISFFISGLIINLLQLILCITVWNFNKTLYRKLNYYLAYSLYSQMVFLVAWWSKSDITLYVKKDVFDKYFGKEHALFVSNHRYEIDWLIGCQMSDKIRALGNCKAYSKKSLQYMPVIGWAWKFSEYVFLERSFDKDREIISRQISELGDYPDAIWLTLFPEGTRFSPKKHEESMEFAKKNGLPLLKYHLTPHTKGFVTSLKSMKGKINAIYNVIVAFKDEEPNPTMTNLLLGRKMKPCLYVERVPLDEVPDSEEDAAKWLRDSFIKKDKLYESFRNTGDFFTESGFERVPSMILKPRPYSLINTVFWNAAVLIPAFKFLLGLLFNGQILYFSMVSSIFFAFFILLKKLIGFSKISKSSSYGTTKRKEK